jgi:hypothetical protein
MNAYTTAEGQSSVPADCSELEQRDVRALTEYMTVLPEMGRAENAPDLYLVVSESGSEYLVDTREGACECPDAVNRDVRCKHLRRVGYATGETPIPAQANAEAVDDGLGERINGGPVRAAADGGLIEADTADTNSGGDPSESDPSYTYHYEPPAVGGARYVRCTECGAECVPAEPACLAHHNGCSEGSR